MLLQKIHLQFGEYRIDEAARKLFRGQEPIPLSAKVFELLRYMAKNPNRPLLKKELLEAVWPDSFVEESNLSQNIFVLRKAMGEAGSKMIVTLPGTGYQFAATVSEVPSPQADATIGETAVRRTLETTETRIVYQQDTEEHVPFWQSPATLETTETRIVYQQDTEEHVPFWQSPATLGFACAALVLLSVASWLGWQRWEDRVGGPPVQVIVDDLEGSTGDPVLDRTVINVLRSEMTQSPFVTVVSASTLRRTLVTMMHKPDDPVTGQVARDLCERTDSQALLHVVVARAGTHYLLTEEATNCADGTNLATAQKEVARVDDLPDAIKKNGATVRHSLGESRRTIARFNTPLVPAGTGSLEALKDYSQGYYLAEHGRFKEAIELLKHAVAIDPDFSTAYLNLGIYSANLGDFESMRPYLTKAYETRRYATEPNRLYIEAFYNTETTGDLYESIRDYQSWINVYPRQPQPWSGLGEVNRLLGKSHEAAVANHQVLQLLPNVAIAYYGLADAQMRSGDFQSALATCRLSISRNLDSENIRLTLLRLGHLMHDNKLISEQEAWLREHPDAGLTLFNQANFAQDEGRLHDAEKLFDQAVDVFAQQGVPQAGNAIKMQMASSWWALERPELAHKYLQAAPLQTEFGNLLALAESGQPELAAKMLNAKLAAQPQSTLWNRRYAPLLRGEFLLLAHKPQDAVLQMEASRELDGQSADGYYLRGIAKMQANQLPQAEAEFRDLLAHPQIEPTAYQLPLARLQLARVLNMEGNKTASAEVYREFLVSWKDADPDAALLLEARSELAKLSR